MEDPLYPALFLVIFSVLVLGMVVLHRMRRANQRLRSQLETAEAEMRSMNSEYNANTRPKWEFALTQHALGKVHIISRVEVEFLSSFCLQTEAPLLPICHLNYFEITIVSLPTSTSLSFGLAPKDVIGVSIPGVAPGSVGLNLNSLEVLVGGVTKRNRFRCRSRAVIPGDIIGCFFNPFQHRLYYTFNGRPQPSLVYKPSAHRLYPTLHADGPCTIKSNFGHIPFIYPWANTYHYGLASSHPEDSSPPEYIPPAVTPLPIYSEPPAPPPLSPPGSPHSTTPSTTLPSPDAYPASTVLTVESPPYPTTITVESPPYSTILTYPHP